jgi:hypothetical protein
MGMAVEFFLSFSYFQKLSNDPSRLDPEDPRRYILLIVSVLNAILLMIAMVYSSSFGIKLPLIVTVLSYNLMKFWYLVSVVDDPRRVKESLLTGLFLIGSVLSLSYKGLNLISYVFVEILEPMGVFKIPKA